MPKPSSDLTGIRPNWWVVLPICALLLLAAILFALVLTLPAVRANTAQPPVNSRALSWRAIILWDVATIGAVLWLCWEILKQTLTRFTADGISQPRLMGKVHIRWSDVVWVSPGVTIGSVTAKIPVSPHAFRNPKEIIQAIMERIPQHTRVVERPSFGAWVVEMVQRRRN